ncbi:galactose oxidase [Dacryopinax primogenitus]|uniref:Galactose oxidase n=1 Tax=Dacryopinax primogenitus (strain DJM 731) TaxID=1858805 RepID=M5FXD9_DACPD|nr:galactose oxidase [Dacryopinax primogenitus]EJT98146.1 galactose oxidase [Dacryopinax primogenitus]
MAKKKGNAAAKAAKKAKIEKKSAKKEDKATKKGSQDDQDDQDLETILEEMRKEWEEKHRVTEETVEGPPSRRANATFTPDPNGNYLWSIGGEYFSDDGKAYFYNDVYRYTPEKDEWRRYTSPTCPGPRSAHATVGMPQAGGKLFLFGGEFSSLNQTSFHHYRDFWQFDIPTGTWERIETKVRPTARSGHRMAVWKHLIVLFGGFYDPGVRTVYLNDIWLFDTQTYKWQEVEFRDVDRKPSPRSGFSFLPVPEGVILHGGYCKEYVKGKRAHGVALEDNWLLRMDADPKLLKWERRKKAGHPPSARSGCTMAWWANRGMGILFGGVFDNDTDEETLESTFYNDMYGYQTSGNGKWVSLMLRRPKKAGGRRKRVPEVTLKTPAEQEDAQEEGHDEVEEDGDAIDVDETPVSPKVVIPTPIAIPDVVTSPIDDDPYDPEDTLPPPRYNAMLAVLRNTLFIYGGIYESGAREYTLDDFYALQLDKMDRFYCLRPNTIVFGNEESNDDDSEDSSDVDSLELNEQADEDEDEAEGEETKDQLMETEPPDKDIREKATAFMGVSMDATRSPEEVISTPLPGETIAMFYDRSRTYWAQKALEITQNRGKQGRRDGFELAQEKYASYKPLLEEVERILAEAGLDEEEIKRSAAGPSASGVSRNRR